MRRYAGSIGRTAQGTNDSMDATLFFRATQET